MGKFPASLLSIVFQLYLIDSVLADEQVRRAQEELRKRHLYYGDIAGEMTPAVTVAIHAYQQKKGLPRTGRLDPETSASLGLSKMENPAKAEPVGTPFVFVESGELRGANGETLPVSIVAAVSSDGAAPETTTAAADAEETGVNDAASIIKERRVLNPRSHVRSRRSQPPPETNPFVRALNTVDHAIKLLVGDTQPRKKRVVATRL